MQSVEIKGMKEVQEIIDNVLDLVKRVRGEAFEELGSELLNDVREEIGGSGRVAGVQEYRVGSGKGYVVVRPKANTELGGYAAGYVTNALENGHKQTAGRYIPAIGMKTKATYVQGKHMYQGLPVPRLANAAAEEISKKIVAGLKEIL